MEESNAPETVKYVTSRCQHCDGGIEFDANGLNEGGFEIVKCPHCERETNLHIPQAKEPDADEELVQQCIAVIISEQNASATLLQRRLRLGYTKATQIIDELEARGIVGPSKGALPRDILMNQEESEKAPPSKTPKGNLAEQTNLGINLLEGIGVQKNEAEGARLLKLAAEAGYAHAEYSYGCLFYLGRVVEKNFAAAFEWWKKAAEHGDPIAQNNIGVFYKDGEGVEKSYIEAFKWFKLASHQRNKLAERNLAGLLLKLNETQLLSLGQEAIALRKQMVFTPCDFGSFVGQTRIKDRLLMATAAAKQRCEALDHVLLIGPAGSGKATLANIIAHTMGANLKAANAATITKSSDLAGLLTNLEEGDILFIDEIHRLQKPIEEYLQLAMKNFKLDIIIDQEPNPREVRLNLPRFTLVGATAQREKISHNLVSLFPIVESFEKYSATELTEFAKRFAGALDISIEDSAAEQIARSSDGTPLDVLNGWRHVRDYVQVNKLSQTATAEIVTNALKLIAPKVKKPDSENGRRGIPSEIRREVWRRDNGRCVKCGSRENLEYDHIIPVSKGGSNTARNIELLCEVCNRSKSDSIQ